MMSRTKLWREAATLIILAKSCKIKGNDYNYKVLAFSRSENTSFMPKHTVFPGGACDSIDQSSEWIKHFKNLGVTDDHLNKVTKVKGDSRPTIFETSDNDNIKKEISLRITAIRETFEELGILICRKKHDINKDNILGSFEEDFDREKWQEVVHNDPSKFLDLCQNLEVVPDLWSLYEWSVWLTPAIFKKRYDTAFFLVALDSVPDVIIEETEVLKYYWKTPTEYLNMFKNDEVWLPTPQAYEISRLTKIKEINKLAEFAKERNNKGTAQFLPAQFQCSDGMVGLLVGDDFYPKDPNKFKKPGDEFVNESVESFRMKTNRFHRVEWKSLTDFKIQLNFSPFNEHLSPILDDYIKNKL